MPDNRRYPKRPVLGVGALIFNRNRILLVERGKEPLKGYWSPRRRNTHIRRFRHISGVGPGFVVVCRRPSTANQPQSVDPPP